MGTRTPDEAPRDGASSTNAVSDVDEEYAEVRVGRQGRVVIPAPFRAALDIEAGSVLVARTDGHRLVLEPREAIKERLRAELVPLRVDDRISLADELIDERRKDAWREQEHER